MAKLDIDLKVNDMFGDKTDEKNEDSSEDEPKPTQQIDIIEEKKNVEIERSKWKTRRKMAWMAIFAEVLVTIALFIAPIEEKRMSVIAEPIIWFYFSMTSIIGFYMGATTWAYIGKGRRK